MPPSDDGLALQREAYGQAVPVAEGFWLLATRHHGAGLSRFPEANNRSFILRLTDAGTGRPGLVVFNATDPVQAFPAVRRVCAETGLDVREVVSTSGGHHAYMGAWHDEFPQAQLRVGARRVPHTTQGRELLARPRVDTMDPGDPLPHYAAQLEAVTFTEFLGPPEFASPLAGGADSLWATIVAARRLLSSTDPYDELWLYHRATDTVIGGENLAPSFTPQAHAALPFVVRRTVKLGRVAVHRKMIDPEAIDRSWRAVLRWPGRTLLGMHDSVGGGFRGDVASALRDAAQRRGQLIARGDDA
ncbi:MAG: hypothetical protein AAF799_18430 [Myxococcota bacterium]